jgi:hypothetical protein
MINEKERPIGREDWLNYNQEFVFVAHEDAEMETIEHPNDNEMPMEEDKTTDEEEYEEEYCLMAKEPAARQPNSQKFTRTTWLADSAASCHLCNKDTYLYNVQAIHSPVKIGNEKTMIANKMGRMKVFKV